MKGKKILILGTGGTSKTAQVVAKDLGASSVLVVSRSKKENCVTYEEATSAHLDTEIIINTTPSGMYPDCDSQPIDISVFRNLEGIVDAVYNPLRTNLVLNAKADDYKVKLGDEDMESITAYIESFKEAVTEECRKLLSKIIRLSDAVPYVIASGYRKYIFDILLNETEKYIVDRSKINVKRDS